MFALYEENQRMFVGNDNLRYLNVTVSRERGLNKKVIVSFKTWYQEVCCQNSLIK